MYLHDNLINIVDYSGLSLALLPQALVMSEIKKKCNTTIIIMPIIFGIYHIWRQRKNKMLRQQDEAHKLFAVFCFWS